MVQVDAGPKTLDDGKLPLLPELLAFHGAIKEVVQQLRGGDHLSLAPAVNDQGLQEPVRRVPNQFLGLLDQLEQEGVVGGPPVLIVRQLKALKELFLQPLSKFAVISSKLVSIGQKDGEVRGKTNC